MDIAKHIAALTELRETREQLGDRTRAAVEAAHADGMSGAQIAKHLGITRQAVNRIYLSKKRRGDRAAGSIAAGLVALLGVLALATPANADKATAPRTGERKATVRVHDITVRAATTPIPHGSQIDNISFYVDGKLAPAEGVGNACRVDYLTHRGVVIRLDVCGPGNQPAKVTVANVGAHPHRVTIRLRFVV